MVQESRLLPKPVWGGILTVLMIAAFTSGCSTTQWSSEIQPNYVAPLEYSHMDVPQLQQQLSACKARLSSVCQRQDSCKTKDQQMSAVSWILFWPAMFAIKNEDHSIEIADLKGRVNTLEQLIAQKSTGE